MSLNCESRDHFLHARPLCVGVLLLGLGGVIGCSAEPLFRDEPINCAVEDPYDFNLTTVTFACYGDSTPDGGTANGPAPSLPIGGAGLCETQTAQVLISGHNNDWGSTCNGSNFGSGPVDESAYEGISFWARAAAGTSQGFTLSLYDANTTPYDPNYTPGGRCKVYNAIDGGIAGSTTVGVADPQTGQILTGVAVASRQPDECGNNKGNGYDYVMAVTNEWALYTIPWAKFTQGAYPNRVPNSVLVAGTEPGTGLLTTELFSLGIRPPKEAPFELWIDKLSFYRKRVHDAGPDLGPDAGLGTELDAGLDAELDAGFGADLGAALDAAPSVDVN